MHYYNYASYIIILVHTNRLQQLNFTRFMKEQYSSGSAIVRNITNRHRSSSLITKLAQSIDSFCILNLLCHYCNNH